MLKITRSSDEPASSKNNGSNPIFRKNKNNDEINRLGIANDNIEYTKSEKLDSHKLFKFWKLKSETLAKFKKLSKNQKLPKFDIRNVGLGFLISNIRTTFNSL